MAESSMAYITRELKAELERLGSLDLSCDKDELELEIRRAKAVQGIAREVNASAQNVLATARLRAEYAGAKTVTDAIKSIGA